MVALSCVRSTLFEHCGAQSHNNAIFVEHSCSGPRTMIFLCPHKKRTMHPPCHTRPRDCVFQLRPSPSNPSPPSNKVKKRKRCRNRRNTFPLHFPRPRWTTKSKGSFKDCSRSPRTIYTAPCSLVGQRKKAIARIRLIGGALIPSPLHYQQNHDPRNTRSPAAEMCERTRTLYACKHMMVAAPANCGRSWCHPTLRNKIDTQEPCKRCKEITAAVNKLADKIATRLHLG